jgi:hypothetical protein
LRENRARDRLEEAPFYLKEMLLDETIQIPHYAVGWGESCSAKLGVQSSYGTILERK